MDNFAKTIHGVENPSHFMFNAIVSPTEEKTPRLTKDAHHGRGVHYRSSPALSSNKQPMGGIQPINGGGKEF
ncbi:MAG TPA: hypothetical protein ENN39_06200 [Desulfonatronum sp.]|nr:hypothetical protein [Desulfonatronum sp.]